MIERTQNPKFSSVQWLNKKPKQSLFKYNKQEDSMEPKYTFFRVLNQIEPDRR